MPTRAVPSMIRLTAAREGQGKPLPHPIAFQVDRGYYRVFLNGLKNSLPLDEEERFDLYAAQLLTHFIFSLMGHCRLKFSAILIGTTTVVYDNLV